MPVIRDFCAAFGDEAADCLRSTDLAEAMRVPLYNFNQLVYKGKFPDPDFRNPTLRAWKPATVAEHNKTIAARAIKIAARRRS